MKQTEHTSAGRELGFRNGLRLFIPTREIAGAGDVISDSKSAKLISGVEAEPLVYWPDDRGYFEELFRFGNEGVARDFIPSGQNHIQVSMAISYPGVIKAIHYHFEQTDLWVPVQGMFQVFLCDLREGSKTFGAINTMFLGQLRPWALRIPPGVGHGYKVVGTESGLLVYATNRFYNPSDEGRIPFDEPSIKYVWELPPR